ncbi:MAG: ATP-binding cassette domain-containing protein, partial [Caldimonas sp.]
MIEVRALAKSFPAPGRARFGWPRRRAARPNVAGDAGGSGAADRRGGSGAADRDAAGRRVRAVVDVSFDAPDGRITGLLGPNGAGKTTTLRMLAALIAPDAGTMRVDGIDVVARPRDVLARMGVLSDARGLYPRLTARENIVYYGALHGMADDAAQARAEELARMLEMVPLLDRRTA